MPEAGHPETLPDALPILSNVPGSFAWGVLHHRHPKLVKQIRDAFPYPLDQDHALDQLGQESSAGVITPFGRYAPDRDVWDRRLVGDRHWPATTPFASLTRYFPGPVAALRTLKSDVVVGLDEQVLSTLESTGEQWRTNGTNALIQVRS